MIYETSDKHVTWRSLFFVSVFCAYLCCPGDILSLYLLKYFCASVGIEWKAPPLSFQVGKNKLWMRNWERVGKLVTVLCHSCTRFITPDTSWAVLTVQSRIPILSLISFSFHSRAAGILLLKCVHGLFLFVFPFVFFQMKPFKQNFLFSLTQMIFSKSVK